MTRKPAIIIASILLLLIGGGGVAFFHHLHTQSAPQHSQIMQSLSDSSTDIGDGWQLTGYESFAFNIVNRTRWLTLLGFKEKVVMEGTFLFDREATGETAEMILHHEDERIDKVTFSGKTPAATESLKQAVSRKFPRLVR